MLRIYNLLKVLTFTIQVIFITIIEKELLIARNRKSTRKKPRSRRKQGRILLKPDRNPHLNIRFIELAGIDLEKRIGGVAYQ